MSNAIAKVWVGAALVTGFLAGSLVQRETADILVAQLSLEEREDLRSQLRLRQSWRANQLSLGDQITATESGMVETHSGLSASERVELREQLRFMAGGGEVMPVNNRYQGGMVARDDDRINPQTLIEVSGPTR